MLNVILLLLSLTWVIYCVVWFITPIRRDRIIAEKEGRFLGGVICFVLAVPLLISTLIITFDKDVQANDIFVQDENTYSPQSDHGIFWTVYFHYIDPGNQSNATEKGNNWVILVSLLGLFLINGLLVTTILNWIDQRKDQRQTGKVRYGRFAFWKKKYAVVIGANEIASSVIKQLFTKKKLDYIILQTSSKVDEVRDVLSSHLPESYLDKIIIYNALRDSQDELELLYIENAVDLYILGENTTWNGGETYHDAISMRCLTIVANLLKNIKETAEKKGKEFKIRECKVLFDYQTTNSIFQFADVAIAARDTMRVVPFNRYETWARMVMVDNCAKEVIASDEKNVLGKEITETNYTPLDGEGITHDSQEHVHLVIVGMSKMGVALGQQALLQAHYPNFDDTAANPKRTRITFIDTYADTEMAFFKGRYTRLFELMRHRYIDTTIQETYQKDWQDPLMNNEQWQHLCDPNQRTNFLDVEVEFIKGAIESDNVRSILSEISANDTAKVTIAICLTQTYQAVAASLYLPLEVYDNVQEIWVYQREVSDIIKSLTNAQMVDLGNSQWTDIPYQRYRNLRPFGMLYADIVDDSIRTERAKLVNLAYEMGTNPSVLNDSDGLLKKANDDWKRLPIHLRLSNQNFIDTINQKLRSVPLLKSVPLNSIDNSEKDALSRCEHNRWNMEKLLIGYSPCDKSTYDELLGYLQKGMIKEYKSRKKELKKLTTKVHPDICSCNKLKTIDPDAISYDETLNAAIPDIIRLVDSDTLPNNKSMDEI